MSDKEPPQKPAADGESPRLKELREMDREDLEEQHEIVRKLRQKLN
jgi:hypothetical protein